MTPGRRILLWSLIVFTVSVVCFPLYLIVISSVKQDSDLFSRKFSLFPNETITFQNYVELFQKTLFARYFLNSLIVAVLATVGSVVAAVLAGFGITRFEFPGR